MPFNPSHLQDLLASIAPVNRLWIGYSGGVDSSVLLHQLVSLRDQLPEIAGAIHVHHGLSPDADKWARFCQSTCDGYGLNCTVIEVDARNQAGESPEQAARTARYTALMKLLDANDVVLLAHHQDDQAETFLYQALRGSGPHGLSAMPAIKPFGSGYLLRPMLEISRDEIQQYAELKQLEWMEDQSNLDTSLDRNFLRHRVFPLLRERWPAVGKTLSRAARHTAILTKEADRTLLMQLATMRGSREGTLSIKGLLQQPFSTAALLIRTWIRAAELPVPAAHQVEELLQNQLLAASDRQIRVSWPGAEVRRYQDDLYAMHPLAPLGQPDWQYDWTLDELCRIEELGADLQATRTKGQGIAARHCDKGLVVKPRSGGETCQPVGRQHHYELKKLYQESSIPPWERERTPLIYIGEQLAAVGHLWVCHEFAAAENEPGYQIIWSL